MATVLTPEVDDYRVSTEDMTSVWIMVGDVEVNLYVDENTVTVASGTSAAFDAGEASIHKHELTRT